MIADGDGGGPQWHAAGQAAQHGLNSVAFGLLTVVDHLLLQLHRFKLHVALWRGVRKGRSALQKYMFLYSCP